MLELVLVLVLVVMLIEVLIGTLMRALMAVVLVPWLMVCGVGLGVFCSMWILGVEACLVDMS